LCYAGEVALAHHDKHVHGPKAKRVQCDEISSFVHAKAKNAPKSTRGRSDDWRLLDLDRDRHQFEVADLLLGRRPRRRVRIDANGRSRERLANRVQLTTDGHRAYLQAGTGNFRQ
jgi:hypothetical protein